MEKLVLVIIEDVERVRQGLSAYFTNHELFEKVISYSNMEDALIDLENGLKPDIVMSDIGLPGIDGIAGIKQITSLVPDCDVIMLTVFMESNKIFNALCAGATGYLLKGTPMLEIEKAIIEIHQGGAYMSPSIARKVLEHFKNPIKSNAHELNFKEREVIHGLLNGLTYKMISVKLGVPMDTVRLRIKTIYRKLQVNSRDEIFQKALRGEI